MSTFCVNSGITYSDLAAADAAEGGTDYLVPTEYHQSGTSTPNVNLSAANYPSSYIIRAVSGEETTGEMNVGALISGNISSLVDGGQISDLRTTNINMGTTPNAVLRRLVVDAGGGSTDGIVFNDTIDAEDILIFNCNDGFLSSVVRNNSNINKCTVIGATRFGYAQGKFTNCVDINSANQGYFNEAAASSGTWEHDGSGTDTITESPVTDIFVDFANGDYRIVSTSSVGVAGAGAFIQSTTPPTGITSSGAFVSDDSVTIGTSDIVLTSSGEFTSEDSTLTGSSETTITTYGEFVSVDAEVVGTSETVVTSSGLFISDDSIIQGSGADIVSSSGAFIASDSLVTGISSVLLTSSGEFVASDSEISGTSNTTLTSFGEFLSDDSQINGVGQLEITSLGEFLSSDSIVTGAESPVIVSSGSFLSSDSQVVGNSTLLVTSSGAFISSDAVIQGTDMQDVPSVFEGILSVERITSNYSSISITPKYSATSN